MEKECIKNKFHGARETLAPVLHTVSEWCKRLVWLLPPVVVLIAMLVTYQVNGLYPFTGKTIAWCDMEQQLIPLLLQFKDVLAGKEDFFFSFKNAGGMNFYGVFFFFLASPFTFLVAFVDKADMASFCNVLVMLKMSVCALTASLYFYRKNKNAPLLNVALSVLYAYSGYTMMYYQNVMWLDVAYLFPLLLWGLENLQKGKRALFVIALSASMVANYYLGYMIVVFLILYAFVWCLLSKDKKFALDFVLSCLLAALLTAVVWLPSFWQYLSSGRTTSILANLINSSVITHYQTALPTIFSVLFLFPFALMQKKEMDERLRLILLIATLVPIIFEPVNKMWQTGSYMSFPTRYAFMTVFLCLSLAFDGMGKTAREEGTAWEDYKQKLKSEAPRYALSGIFLLTSIAYSVFGCAYTDKHVETMDQYSHSLWGNTQSFETLLTLYAIALLVGAIAYVLWRFRLLKPTLLWLAVLVMVASELYVAPATYMLTPAHEVEWYQQVVELGDKIEDDGFYRVKTDREYSGHDFDVNLMGGLGYNALGHYTSLTKQNYMQTIKRFGYTSYWMEVGNSGGTMVTDALLSIGYQISSKSSSADIYEGSYFHIAKTEGCLPLGVIAKTDIIGREKGCENLTRGEMQVTLYQDFFGTDGITTYELNEAEAHNLTVREENGKYRLTPTGSNAYLSFTLPVKGKSRVYLSAFDENTNALNQAINKKFSVQTAKYRLDSYPTQKQNGILDLGEYASTVTVKVGVKEETLVKEMSIVAIESEKTQAYIGQTPTLGLTVERGKVGGRYAAKGGECVFLSVPYDEGLTLKINGKETDLHEVYGGFTAFYLEEGVNEIEITFRPQGFTVGLGVSLLGVVIALLGVGIRIFIRRRKERKECVLDRVAYCGVIAVGVLVVVLIYIAPMILCAL